MEHRHVQVLLSAAIMCVAACTSTTLRAPDRVVLLRPEEAEPPVGALRSVPRSVPASPNPDGPRIVLVEPEDGGSYRSPFAVEVRFEPMDGRRIDVETLEVKVLKLWHDYDITDRIRPHVTQEGIRVEHAELPSGTHRLDLGIADDEGHWSSRQFEVTVE